MAWGPTVVEQNDKNCLLISNIFISNKETSYKVNKNEGRKPNVKHETSDMNFVPKEFTSFISLTFSFGKL